MSGGKDLNSLLEEAQQMLSSVGEVLTSTVQQGVEVIKNYEELATSKVASITESKRKELAELSVYGESVKSCVEKRQNDFAKVEEKLRKELAACYKKNYSSLDKVSTEKSSVREEALRIKEELQQTMLNCMSATNKTECFGRALDNLRKRLKTLSARIGGILKKEAEARAKASKAVFECDKKATDDAYKKCTAIVNDIKECTAAERQ